MAQDARNANWQPAQAAHGSPSPYPETQDAFNSPRNPETPYTNRSAYSSQNFFSFSPNPSTESAHPSPPNIWDPLQQNPPLYTQRDNSFAALLNPYDPGERASDRPRTRRKPPPGWWSGVSRLYKERWTPAWSMIFFLLCGIAFALGHHFYYEHLDGTVPDKQLRKLRYGTALAFFAKTSLVTAVILAYRQRVWMIVRHKILTLSVVDSLFAAAEDLIALFHLEAFKRAKVAMFLALYIWSTPLVVILTSETLSVEPKREWLNTTCPGVYTLNFDHEISSYWRAPLKTDDGYYQISVSTWNSTVVAPSEEPLKMNSTAFDYFTDASQQFQRVAMRSKYLGGVVSQENISEVVCGPGWNCSFKIEFTGPGYKCELLNSNGGDKIKKLGGADAPFNTSIIVPNGDYQYYAKLDAGDYEPQLKDVEIGGMPKMDPPYPKNLGAFRTEPLLWIGYTTLTDKANVTALPPDNLAKGWNESFVANILGCQHYETNYTVNMTYENGILDHRVTKRENTSLIIDTRFLPNTNSSGNNGLIDNTTATPESNYVFPLDWEKYRKVAAFHSVGRQLRNTLNGTIAYQYKASNTDALITRLIEKPNYFTIEKFSEGVETLYEEIVLSLMSDPQFAAVSWAYDPTKMAGQDMDYGYNRSRYPCTRYRTINAYQYHKRDLWLVYSIAILLALIAVILGISAMRHERVYRDTRFSSIVAVTRGHSLNNVGWDDDGSAKKVKIGFGMVQDSTGETKHGFGLEGDVAQHHSAGDTLRSPVIQMREWRERRASRYMGSPR